MTNPVITATIDSVTDIARGIRILRVRADDSSLSWLAGQYMELTFSGMPPRAYSIATAPHSNVLEFHIRDAQSGGVSSHIVTTLKPGDALTLRGPFGHAASIPGETNPLLLIAGGMGLSPLKAVAEDALHNNHPGPVILCWGVKTQDDLYLGPLFETLERQYPQFTFMPVIESNGGQTAAQALRAAFPDLSGMRIYLAGSPEMITATLPHLNALGARRDMIHGDDKILAPAWPLPKSTPGATP